MEFDSPFAPGDLPSGLPPAEQLLWLIHWLSAAGRQLRRKLADVAAESDLSDSELLVVWLCGGEGRVQVELAAAVGVSPAQMSGLVERLGQRGLVAMNRPARDRRRQVWKTAPAGRELLASLAAPLQSFAASLECRLATHEQRLLQELCEQLASTDGDLADRSVCRTGKEAA